MKIKKLLLVTLSLLFIINISNFSLLLVNLNDTFIYLFLASKESLSLICHQQKEKLFSFGNFHSILCSRCTGIYIGALMFNIFLIKFSFTKLNWQKFFFISIFLMILDVIFYQSGFYKYSQTIAAITGFLFGSSSIGMLFLGLKNILKELNETK